MAATNLPSVQKEIIRYGTTTYLASGVLGNIFNCIMFMQRSHRHTASSTYFLALSIFGIIHLMWTISPNLYTLNYPDLHTQSLVYCKMRLFGSHVLGQYLRYIVVFACADRFFVTRVNVRIRSLNSVPVARKLILIMCIVCSLIAIHIPILMEIRGTVCGMFGIYRLIYAIYQIIVVGILPPLFMSIFSILTIRSLRQLHGTHQAHARTRDRYLMRMVIAEVIVNIISSIPYSINLIYGAATYYTVNKSTERIAIETFISFFSQFLIYLTSVVPFYLFMLTSKPFRKEFFCIVVKCWYKYILHRVQVVPISQQNNTATNNVTTVIGRR